MNTTDDTVSFLEAKIRSIIFSPNFDADSDIVLCDLRSTRCHAVRPHITSNNQQNFHNMTVKSKQICPQ